MTHRWPLCCLELPTRFSSSLESVWLSFAPEPLTNTIPVSSSSSETSRELNVRGEPASGLPAAELPALARRRGRAGTLNEPSDSGPEDEGLDTGVGRRTVNETVEGVGGMSSSFTFLFQLDRAVVESALSALPTSSSNYHWTTLTAFLTRPLSPGSREDSRSGPQCEFSCTDKLFPRQSFSQVDCSTLHSYGTSESLGGRAALTHYFAA